MRTFIQLRDGVGFAVVHTNGDVDHTITPDHTTAIEVETDNADDFLNMKYNFETKSWTKPSLILWGVPDEKGNIVEVQRTYFQHLAHGPTLPDDFEGNWKWINNEWVKPYIEAEVIETPSQISAPVDETDEERIARVQANTIG